MSYGGIINQEPGIGSLYESVEGVVGWGPAQYVNYFRYSGLISGASRDDSHTANTSILRPGLLMGYHVANQLWVPFTDDVAANVGGEIMGVFMRPVDVTMGGVNTNRWGGYLLRPGAPIKLSALWTNDTDGTGTAGAVSSHDNLVAIRAALVAKGYQLDDWYNPDITP